MANKLGKGLSDLLGENYIDIDLDVDGEVIVDVLLSEIKPNPYQPRKVFNDEQIDELAASIKEHGVFQPIILKKVTNGYIIVAGERRYRACKKLGLEKIPAIIREYNQAKVAEIALLENLQREDLNSIEEAEAYRQIMSELGITQEELAKRVGKSRSYVTNMLGLLTLPKAVQQLVLENKMTMGHARALSKLNDKKKINQLARQVVEKGLSVRQTEELANKNKKNKVVVKTDYSNLEEKLKQKGFDAVISNNKVLLKGDVEKIVKEILGE